MSDTARTRNDAVQKLAKMIEDIDFAMLTTVQPDGTLRSRPMSTQKAEFDGTLWFFTESNAPKVDEVQQERQVNVSYSDPKNNRWVSVSGTATVSRDRAKIHELWQPIHKAWFPEGKDDPNLALLRVDVTAAEYWDSANSKMVELVGLVKALVTGQRMEPGENEKLNFS